MDFIEKLVPQSVKSLPTFMDFEGQRKAERIFQVTISVFAIVGFCWGYISQQFSHTVFIVIFGSAVSALVILPPWPMFRRTPLKWQPSRVFDTDEQSPLDSPSVKRDKKKK